jgi:hypothetical protein
VLWITPLAIIGVILISQLQRPLDEQDAIRQTIKVCVFATGLLVAISTTILACTNLPREIENRVIYSIVTKPTTRLEIVLGKVLGFARVSLMILLIMGAFSWAYLSLRAWNMRRIIAQRLEQNEVPPTSVATMKYYRDAGLLNAKTLEEPSQTQVFSRLPWDTGTKRFMFGANEGSFYMPFDLTAEMLTPPGASEPGERGLIALVHVGYVKKGGTKEPAMATQPVAKATQPSTLPYYGPYIMSPEERAVVLAGVKSLANPTIGIAIEDANFNSIGSAVPVGLTKQLELTQKDGLTPIAAFIDPKTAKSMVGRTYLRVVGASPDVEYYVDLADSAPAIQLGFPVGPGQFAALPNVTDPADPNKVLPPVFQSRSGNFGQQLRGGTEASPTAVIHFENASVAPDAEGRATFELRSGIEHSGDDDSGENAAIATQVAVQVRNDKTGETSETTIVEPESNRTIFFRLPAASMAGGNFDLLVRCLSRGDHLGLADHSIVLVTSNEPFAFNLFKSLLILWLMAILITSVAIFASTFLSWPIAVVLTLVILLGHWGVDQLGDATAPGIGNQVVTDFGLRSPAKAEAVRASVEKLSAMLNFISTVLPDISKFAAVENLERGVMIPMATLKDAVLVTLGFGVPLVLLAYVFLKNKEVAP